MHRETRQTSLGHVAKKNSIFAVLITVERWKFLEFHKLLEFLQFLEFLFCFGFSRLFLLFSLFSSLFSFLFSEFQVRLRSVSLEPGAAVSM